MDKDIGGGREAQQRVARPRLFQVEDDTLLVAIDVEVIGRHPGVPRRTDAAHHLAFGRLDLDDFRAEIAKDLGRHRPQHRDRQIDDADPRQRSRHIGLQHHCRLRLTPSSRGPLAHGLDPWGRPGSTYPRPRRLKSRSRPSPRRRLSANIPAEAEQIRGNRMIAPPDSDDLDHVKAWFRRLSEHVQAVDFAGAHWLFSEDMIAFGTFENFITGREAVERAQWRNVWPVTSAFGYRMDDIRAIVALDRLLAIVIGVFDLT